ncbi:MAG: DUF2207 domain-containing protein, partial [Cyanobacteria bacterium J06642_11]
MTLQSNGDVVVTETQRYVFGNNPTEKLNRSIPLKDIVGVTDVAVYENDMPLPIYTDIANNHYSIQWQSALPAPAVHTFKLQYRAVGVVQERDERSQLYWTALFPEQSTSIQRGKVTVHVPDALADQVTAFKSEGVPSRKRKLNPTTFEFIVSRTLAPKKFLKIRLLFPANILNVSPTPGFYWPPHPLSVVSSMLSSALPWIILAGLFLWFIRVIVSAAKQCPQCKKLTLERSSHILQAATFS